MAEREGHNVTIGLDIQILPILVVGLVFGDRFKKAFGKTEDKDKEKEKEKREIEKREETTPQAIMSSLKVEHSIPTEEAEKAKEDLRILNLEKEIVSYALTRLYEAEAEGKITKDERVQLVEKYKNEMNNIDTQINRKQMTVKLHDLEGTQAELIKMFHDKFGEINKNIDDIRSTLGVSSKEAPKIETSPEISRPETATATPKEKKVEEKPVPKVKIPPKTKAEEKIEAIQEEVMKVLERLEQMETES
ncbi:MAG: hypothetical protein QG670_2465 [Thermoproteota archaeon]|nr:hypothetical protein [Thermoproteota archaeon]